MNRPQCKAWLGAGFATFALSACVAWAPGDPYAGYGYPNYAPPTAHVEVVPASPGAAYVWTPGHWVWSGGRYSWSSGRWALPPRGYRAWRHGHWAQGPRGHYWTPGRWH